MKKLDLRFRGLESKGMTIFVCTLFSHTSSPHARLDSRFHGSEVMKLPREITESRTCGNDGNAKGEA